jgi:hypothetical protein
MKNTFEDLIKKRRDALITRRAELDGHIKEAEAFLNTAIPEINGIHRAIQEFDELLKDAAAPAAEKTDMVINAEGV